MLCQNCGKHEATTHIKRVVNGEFMEMYLCSDCASQLGYGGVFSDFGFDLSNLFGSFFSQPKASKAAVESERCPKCGTSFREIVKSGKIGCADCYDKFYDLLIPSIQRIHGKTQHNGKTVQGEVKKKKEETKEEKIERLKEEMQQAVETQEFERAAQLRDEIRQLEEGEK